MMASLLIDNALQEIAKEYKVGLLVWLKRDPDRWRQLIALESRINEVALVQDEVVLRNALSDYREFFVEMVELYVKGDTLPLFEDRGMEGL